MQRHTFRHPVLLGESAPDYPNIDELHRLFDPGTVPVGPLVLAAKKLLEINQSLAFDAVTVDHQLQLVTLPVVVEASVVDRN